MHLSWWSWNTLCLHLYNTSKYETDDCGGSAYHQCIDAITCNETSSSCYLGDCLSCSNLMEDFILYLTESFDKNSIDDLIYKQW